MHHTVLCGHTGSSNRGCEAIVRSTIDLLNQNKITADIATFNIEQDRSAQLDKCGKLIPYREYQGRVTLQRLYNSGMKRLFHNDFPYEKFRQRDVFKATREAGSSIMVGGDTYCYGREVRLPAYALTRYMEKTGGKSFLWSCSVDAEKIDSEMLENLNRYTMIFPREQNSYQNLIQAGVPEDKLFLMSDSAFALQVEPVAIPEDFNNVLAYNPSYTLGIRVNQENIFRARVTLLKYILKNTDMKIALIPHVFQENFGDLKTCKELAQALGQNNRVMVIDGNYNCCQLKYIISKCRFLIAERTHASIAGYSQLVPTFVIGYSVKSKGIATDLFGTEDGMVIPSTALTEPEDLISPVLHFLDAENVIRSRLSAAIPHYISKAEAAAKVLGDLILECRT